MSKAPHSICDTCLKPITKAQAVVDGKAWCATCYKRETTKGSCPGCGNGIRVLKGAEPQLCKSCKTLDRHCDRCKKPLKKASLVVEGKAYCFPCSRHQKEPRPCELCGELSLFLARDLRHDITVMSCPSCRRTWHVTCSVCGKHREPVAATKDGKHLCAICNAREEKNLGDFICPKCGKPGKMHSKTSCWDCYRESYIRKKYHALLPEINQEWVKDIFTGYVELLVSGTLPESLVQKIKRDMIFFNTIDTAFQRPEDLTILGITKQIGTGWQKRHGLICSYLINSRRIAPLDDPEHKEANALVKQLIMLEDMKGKWFYPRLLSFHHYRQSVLQRYRDRGWKGKNIRCKQLSILTAMRAALKLFDWLDGKVLGVQQINQTHLDRFFDEHKGYCSAIRPFISYLKLKERTFLKVNNQVRKQSANPACDMSFTKYLELLDRWFNPEPGKTNTKEAVIGLFTILYAQRPRRITRLKLSDIKEDGGTYLIRFHKVFIPLDPDTCVVLRKYLSERKLAKRYEGVIENSYLFPGKLGNAPISEEAIYDFWKHLGIGVNMLFSTAMFNMYRAGLQNPQVARVAYGVSGTTACKYYEIADVRLSNEIRDKLHEE